MRLTAVDKLSAGDRLARPVYGDRGELLLAADIELSQRYVDILREQGFGWVYLHSAAGAPAGPPDLLTERLRRLLSSRLDALFDEVRLAADGGALGEDRDELGEAALQRLTARLDWPGLTVAADELLDELMSAAPQVGLIGPRPADGYVVAQAVDSAAVAVQVARRLGYVRSDLRRLALGALLHDVGMMQVDPAVVLKRGRLTHGEQADVARHAEIGYSLLHALRPEDVLIQHVAYQHHERQDGRGYPRGLRGTNTLRMGATGGEGLIVLDAEIVAVADAYASLSGGRPYRAALAPDHVIRAVERLAGTQLNIEIVSVLIGEVPVYPEGAEVHVLSGYYQGLRGIVSRVHRDALHRPTVRLLRDRNGHAIPPVEVDMRGRDDQIALQKRWAG